MWINIHDRCSKAVRTLRFNWIQHPEVILNEKLQTVCLNSDYLKNYPELFEVFWRKLYRRLNKRYHGLLDLKTPAHFVWKIKIMWKKLKCRQRNEQTYEQIRKIITIAQPRKRPILEKVREKLVVDTRFEQLKENDFVYKSFRNLTSLEQENKTLKTLGVLRRTRFTWKKSPIKVLREKLLVAGLQFRGFWRRPYFVQ